MNASTRSCLGDVTSIAIVDATGGTVTLPYEPEQFTRATDVVLVGDPVDLSIPEPIEVPDRSGFEMVSLDVSEPLECGVRFDYIAWDSPFTADGRMPREFGDGANSANARVLVAKMGTGTVALANDAVAWITGPVANDYNYFPDHPGNRQILGVADVSVAGGNTFAYDRYKGPVAVDFVFTNVAWCDGAEPEWGVDSVIIDGDVAVTPTGQPPVALAPALIEFADYGSGE